MKLVNFPLAYRFTDVNYNQFDKDELSQIVVVAKKEALRLRNKIIPKGLHIMQLDEKNTDSGELLKKCCLDQDKNAQEREKLNTFLDFDFQKITIYWSTNLSLIIPKRLFLKYWDDFLYPCDDNVLMTFDNSSFYAIYVEGTLFFYEMK